MEKLPLAYHLKNIDESVLALKKDYGIVGDFVIKSKARMENQLIDFIEELTLKGHEDEEV